MPAAAPGPTASAPARGGNGGLLGGVASTVNSTTAVAGSVTGPVLSGTTATVDSATRASAAGGLAAATPRRMIQLNSSAEAEHSTSANSVFSTRHGQLHMDSGTQLQFRVAGSAESNKQNK